MSTSTPASSSTASGGSGGGSISATGSAPGLPTVPSSLNLRPVRRPPPSTGPKAIPSPASLAPWTFQYAPSGDGKDINLLIMFHGLGDNAGPFFNLAKSFNLPCTAILSLQGPLAIPLMETPTYWSWYQTFDPTFNSLPRPDPSPTIPRLKELLNKLEGLGWEKERIHLFGWGQGGSMALSLARALEVEVGSQPGSAFRSGSQGDRTASSSVGSSGAGPGTNLGSVISICGALISQLPSSSTPTSTSTSTPTSRVKSSTPVGFFTRLSPSSAAHRSTISTLQSSFSWVQVIQGQGRTPGQGAGAAPGKDDMPKGKEEWIGVMRFWSEVLSRGDEGWKGEGEVYEVDR